MRTVSINLLKAFFSPLSTLVKPVEIRPTKGFPHLDVLSVAIALRALKALLLELFLKYDRKLADTTQLLE